MRVVFMGTPEAAVPSLLALAEQFEVAAVYTRRDRPKGRGLKVASSPVKAAATELGLRVVQPRSLKEEAGNLRDIGPDAIVVVAYGMILPADVLDVPTLGCVNVHFSLLPRWRGAAPVERAILAGDERTGITTMLMDPGLDTGPILYQEETPIRAEDTTGTLMRRMAESGPHLLVRTLRDLEAGSVQPRPQEGSEATLAPKLDAAEAALDPRRTAVELERQVRALDPAPGAFLEFRGQRLKIWRAAAVEGDGSPGTIATVEDGIAVQTSVGRLLLEEVQPEGKRRMSGAEFARGRRPVAGEGIGEPSSG